MQVQSTAADHAAFDIVSDGNGGNEAWLMVGDTLYEVDLVSGKGTQVTKIAGVGGAVRDIAAIPKSVSSGEGPIAVRGAHR